MYLPFPLPPGKSIEIFRYPCTSTTIPHPNSEHKARERGITFNEPGTYQIRYIYYVAPKYKNLWKGEKGELYSNPITITLREPTQEEKEILDAIWDHGEYELGFGPILSWGDDVLMPAGDLKALRGVIRKYPNNPTIKYAYFNLARWLLDSNNAESKREAVSIFETLRERFPDYRYEEVGQHLGTAYAQLGMREKAIQIFNEVIEKRPSIAHHFNFMRNKIHYIESENTDAILEWINNRKSGKAYYK